MTAAKSHPEPKSCLLQFSFGLLLTFAVLTGIGMSWVAISIQRANGQDAGAAPMDSKEGQVATALLDIAGMQAKVGDIADAKATARRIGKTYAKPNAYCRQAEAQAYRAIAIAQANAGDIAGAKATAAQIHEQSWKEDTLRSIADAQARAANGTTAEWTTQISQRERAFAYRNIAQKQAEIGDTVGAKTTAAKLRQMAAEISIEYTKASGSTHSAGPMSESQETATSSGGSVEAQLLAGNIEQAKVTAAKIASENEKAMAYNAIATAQTEAGDIAGAKATVRQIGSNEERAIALALIAKAQAEAGDISEAKVTAAGVNLHSQNALAYRWIATAQAEAGDIAGAKVTLRQISDDDERAKARSVIAKAEADAGNIIRVKPHSTPVGKKVEKSGNAKTTADHTPERKKKPMY